MRRPAFTQVLLVLASVLPYLNCLGNQFVFDDNFLVAKHPALVAPFNLATLLSTPYWGPIKAALLWRPVTTLSFSLGTQLGLTSMVWPHAINLALHAAVTLLLYRLVLRLYNDGVVALYAGLLFAVHPLHSEAVTWISGRAELLAAAFSLAAIHLSIAERPWQRWLALPAAFLAVASKESAIVLPAALLYLRWARRRDEARPSWGIALASIAPMLLYLALRRAVLGVWSAPITDAADNPMYGTHVFARLLTVLDCAGRYVGLVLWPARLSADYSAPVLQLVTAPNLYALLGLATMVLLFTLALARRDRVEGFGAAFTLIFYAVASNLIVPIGTIFAERLFYLPSAGLLLVLVVGMATLARRRPAFARPLAAALAVVLALGVTRTWTRNHDWRDEATFFKEGVATQPKSPKMQAAVAVVWNREHQPLKALEHAAAAMRLDPTARPQRETYAATLELLERTDEAIEFLRDIVSKDPADGDARKRLLALLATKGRQEEALRIARDGIAREPAEVAWTVAAAKAAQAMRAYEDAVTLWEDAARLAPRAPDVPLFQAFCLIKLGRMEDAKLAYVEVLRRDPNSSAAMNGYAWALLETGAVDEALRYARMAVEADSVAHNFDTLAQAELRAGNRAAALDAIRKATALEPSNAEYRTRADALATEAR